VTFDMISSVLLDKYPRLVAGEGSELDREFVDVARRVFPLMADMMTPEVISVTTARVACDGGGGPLGHPLVWLTLGTDGEVTCPYCSRRYVRGAGGDDD
ncbi:MAG: zinc-finger domain-containing protein, partial [Pseudomonadota bacterium]|nr:zinc-finger domain-containing protein [Pseudomonadota bacterium]